MESMVELAEFQAKVSSQGRVVLPAAVRRTLGLRTGDTVNLSVDAEGVVRMVSARVLAERLWAANPVAGAPKGSAAAEVRAARDADRERSEDKYAAISARRDSVDRSADELAGELLADLGLEPRE